MKRTRRKVDILTVIDKRNDMYGSLVLRSFRNMSRMKKLTDKRKAKKRIRKFVVSSTKSCKFIL